MKVQWIKGNQPEKEGWYWVYIVNKTRLHAYYDPNSYHKWFREDHDDDINAEEITHYADYELPDFPEEN